jgi:predicted SAM-dependent methyltransferase
MIKLHLGCGQKYLDGYVNIDFPLNEHSLQTKSVADEHHDISTLAYPAKSIKEIRLHHVLEHFDRPTASALMASWNSWLQINGILHIEVPDFEKTAKSAVSFYTRKNIKKVAIRHLFGSHEAHWAIHAEGYSKWMLRDLFECFGFSLIKMNKNSWKGTYNIEAIGIKKKSLVKEECYSYAKKYLKGFLLDDSELPLLDIWLTIFKSQLDKTWSI